MNDTEALRELDKIEQLDPDPTIDAGALELMERIGETRRVSASLSTAIVVHRLRILGDIWL
jgi:hypothetical protein